MLTKRQCKCLKYVKKHGGTDKDFDLNAFNTRFPQDGEGTSKQLQAMGLIEIVMIPDGHLRTSVTSDGHSAIMDYRNSRSDVWQGRIFHFLSGLTTGLIVGFILARFT